MRLFIITSFITLNIFGAQGPDLTLNFATESLRRGGCASVALVPNFWFLMEKTRLQTKAHTAKTSFPFSISTGIRAIPNTCGVISTQFFCQSMGEAFFAGVLPASYLPIAGCLAGALASAPLYDIMNRQTMGENFFPALKGFIKSPITTVPIVLRELAFLGSLRISQPLSQEIQTRLGESPMISNSSYFITGFAGSLLGHPFDSLLTQSQTNQAISRALGNLMRGGVTKAVGIGFFNVLYQNLLLATYTSLRS